MTDSTILQRAKEGKADAIAALMNHSLNSKGIHATAERAGDRLFVNLEADSVPDQALLTKFVHQGVRNLNVDAIETIMVTGRTRGSDRPSWTSTIYLDAQSSKTSPQKVAVSSAPPPPPPAPTRQPPEKPNGSAPRNVMVPPPPPPSRLSNSSLMPDESRDGETLANVETDRPSLTVESGVASASIDDTNLLNDGTDFNQDFDSIDDEGMDTAITSAAPLYDYDVYASHQSSSDREDVLDNASDNGAIAGENIISDGDNITVDGGATDSDSLIGDPLDPNELNTPNDDGSSLYHDAADDLSALVDSDAEDAESDDSRLSTSAELVDVENQPTTPQEFQPSPEPRVQSKASSNPFLLGSVFLVVLGAIGGLVGYSLWSYFSAGGSILDPAITPTPTVAPDETTDGESNTGDGSADDAASDPDANAENLLVEADDVANSAISLSQTAQSSDDWNLVVSRWQRAIDLLGRIPESASQYASVQQRLATYRSSLALAQQQESARSVETSAPLPSTIITATQEVECLAVAASATSPAIELTNVRFDESASTDTTRRVVGCITNHGEAAIANATLDYTGVSTDDPDSSIDGRAELQFANLDPSNTVAFQGDINLPGSLNSVEIKGITWAFIDSDTPQSIDLSLALSVNE